MTKQERWSEAEFNAAEEMWKKGQSASEIGHALNRTRSSVLGVLRRNGVTSNSRTVGAKPVRLKAGVAAPKPVKLKPRIEMPAPVPATPERVFEGSKLWTLRKTFECQFPVSGQGADAFSCCAPIPTMYGYCKAHRKLMYDTPRPRQTPTEPRRVSLMPR